VKSAQALASANFKILKAIQTQGRLLTNWPFRRIMRDIRPLPKWPRLSQAKGSGLRYHRRTDNPVGPHSQISRAVAFLSAGSL
jgi:hypothetical protein